MRSQRIQQTDPPIARAHELMEKYAPSAEETLWLNPPGELFCTSKPGWRFWQPGFGPNQALRGQGWEELADEDRREWPVILLYASKHKEETLELVEAARSRLSQDGRLLFVVPNDYGAKSYEKPLQELDPGLSHENGRKSRLYRLGAAEPSSEPLPLTRPRQRGDGYWSAPGLFSPNAVDQGSALLVEALAGERLSGPVADLGAGWGYLASQLPTQATPHLFESDRRGLLCAQRNLEGRAAHYHWCDLSDLDFWPEGAPTRFSTVITNPPFHSGQREQAGLGQLFARLAHRLLEPDGTLWLVGNSHLAYPRLLSTLYREVEVKAQARGFTVVKAKR